jgi:CDP-glucose 4,6-dehydratase
VEGVAMSVLACLERLRVRNVFVTGHTGFKGSWLLLLLNRLVANVTGYALAPREPVTLRR